MAKNFVQLKLNFGPTDKPFDTPVEDYIMGVLHEKILGNGNKWHDKFSSYNVSGLFGGEIVDGKCLFPNGGYFYVSSCDTDFISTVAKNLLFLNDDLFLRDMHYINYETKISNTHSDFDLVKTVSPILLKHENGYLTFKDDNFLDVLTSQSKEKLMHQGFTDVQVQSLKIEPFHFENAKVKYTKRKNYALPASKVMLVVKGNEECRKTLYEMGLGSSTGYCYGSIEIKK